MNEIYKKFLLWKSRKNKNYFIKQLDYRGRSYNSWNNFFVSRIKSYVEKYNREVLEIIDVEGYDISVLSEKYRDKKIPKKGDEIWGDNIQISRPFRPVSKKPVVEVSGRVRMIVQESACLVLTQGISGIVFALVYPPESELLKTDKKAYVFRVWDSPSKVKEKHILKMMDLVFRIDCFCSVEVFGNKKGQRALISLEVMDSVISQGGSKWWVYVKYYFKFIRAVLRVYGIGAPKN